MTTLVCAHCKRLKVARSRGLCASCHLDPSIRCLYNDVKSTGNRGPGNYYGNPQDMPEPTLALPGTEEKLRVLEQRAALGQNLWHPLDACDMD